MLRIETHIKRLLLVHDCVIVPKFGGFVLQAVPAMQMKEHIFRPFQNPEDLFELLGTEFGIGDFKSYRVKAEKLVRKGSSKGNNEVNI